MLFSHIYVEKNAYEYPLAQSLLQKFSEAQTIIIDDYKDLFNRPRQDFIVQRKSLKLILAKKKHGFLEEGDNRVKSFGSDRVFSCSIIRNCVYHCDYCFLQGMHTSSNVVIYVNIDDFQKHIEKLSYDLKNEKIYLVASYLTDLPAFEHIIPACKIFIDIVRNLDNILLEIRTKSDGFIHLQDIQPHKNVVLVFSISPQEIVRMYEHGTASLHARVLQAKRAIQKGWRVRFCFDPIIYSENWKTYYSNCVKDVFKHINPADIEMISYGVFRMGKTFLNNMQTQRPNTPVLTQNISTYNGLGTYNNEIIQEICSEFNNMILPFVEKNKICFVHG